MPNNQYKQYTQPSETTTANKQAHYPSSTTFHPFYSLAKAFQYKFKNQLIFNEMVNDYQIILLITKYLQVPDLLTLSIVNSKVRSAIYNHSHIQLRILRAKVSYFDSQQTKPLMKIIMEHHEKEDVKLLRMNFSMKNRHNKKKKEEGHSLRLKSEISKDNSLNDLFNLPAGKSELQAVRENIDMIVSNKKKIRFEYDFKIGSERLEKKEKAKPQKSMLKRYVSDFMFFWK